MKRVLVTGANGFIGIALCRCLHAEGFEVVAALRSQDTRFALQGVRSVIIGHINAQTNWNEVVAGVDIVVHLAARVHAMSEVQRRQIDAYRAVNVEGTENLAECAARAGVKRLIFLSSIKVNGEENTNTYSEQCPPSPEDAYGVSKMEAERILKEIADKSAMEVVILRPPLVYGPGVKANFLTLMRLVSQKIPFPLRSVKNQRSFVYLGNLVDCIQCCLTHPSAAGQTYLVSDDQDLSTPELIRLLASAMNKSAFLFHFPVGMLNTLARLAGKTDALKRLLGSLTVDISKIKKDLSWRPPISTKSGMAKTVKWFEGKRGL